MKALPAYKNYTISQRFGENGNGSYATAGLKGHTGMDFVSKKFLTTRKGDCVVAPISGLVYKITNKGNPDLMAFRAVFILSEDRTVECCVGHLLDIYVSEGDQVEMGEPVGIEGNTGEVYVGGVPPTPEQRTAGAGTHCHWQFRAVQRTFTPVYDGHNQFLDLVSPTGNRQDIIYTDPGGAVYWVPAFYNGYNGCFSNEADILTPTPFQWLQIWDVVFTQILKVVKTMTK